jgi:hypothetical protein
MTSKREARTIVRLKITSSKVCPEQITNLLHITPDRVWKAGEKRLHTDIVENQNGWLANSGLSEGNSLEEQLQAILAKFAEVSPQLRELSEIATLEVSCVLYASDIPALNFPPHFVSAMGRWNAGLDIDVYLR